MSKEKDRSEKIIPVATTFSPLEKAFQQEATKANRFEEHLRRLIKMWDEWFDGSKDLPVGDFNKEFTSAEMSLEELGVGHDTGTQSSKRA